MPFLAFEKRVVTNYHKSLLKSPISPSFSPNLFNFQFFNCISIILLFNGSKQRNWDEHPTDRSLMLGKLGIRMELE
jgi:hypothetical protein